MIRVNTGIEGLNEMTEGGIPQGHTVALLGPAGAGKTTFTLQYLWNGLVNDQTCIFISLEEDEESLLKTATNYKWDLQPYLDKEKLSLVKLDASHVSSSMGRLQSELPEIVNSIGASRVVIDPFTLLEMLFDSEAERRKNIFDICRIVGSTNATTLLTSEISREELHTSRYGLVEYVVDGVILLRRIRSKDTGRAQLTLEIVKMRWTDHSKEIKPYTITSEGIVVRTDLRVSL